MLKRSTTALFAACLMVTGAWAPSAAFAADDGAKDAAKDGAKEAGKDDFGKLPPFPESAK